MSRGSLREYIQRCQAILQKLTDNQLYGQLHIRKISAVASATFFIISSTSNSSAAYGWHRDRDEIPDSLFQGQTPPERIAAARVHDGRLIPPPMEETFFPTNFDGQARVLNIDTTVNLTVAINQFYYNPKWRGEVWTPFDQVDLIERTTRLMSTWKDYNEANQFHLFNGVNVFFERYSGFGP